MMHLSLELQPGVALGDFSLGDTLWTVTTALHAQKHRYTSCALAWADAKPGAHNVVLTINQPALTLLFDGLSQQLIVIELGHDPHMYLQYRGNRLAVTDDDQPAPISQKVIQRIFGPTYKPSTRVTADKKQDQALCYPGVIFTFGLADNLLQMVTVLSSAAKDLPRAKEAFQQLPVLPIAAKTRGIDEVLITLPDKATDNPVIDFDIDKGIGPSHVALEIGQTTAEDLLCELGAPEGRFVKQDTRMALHQEDANESIARGDYFLNYFSLGLDFYMHGSSHTLVKVIAHSNTPGESLFGRYERCRWRIRMADASPEATNADSAKAVGDCLSQITGGPRALDGFRLDRTADAVDDAQMPKLTELFGYNRAAIEVTSFQEVETLWLF